MGTIRRRSGLAPRQGGLGRGGAPPGGRYSRSAGDLPGGLGLLGAPQQPDPAGLAGIPGLRLFPGVGQGPRRPVLRLRSPLPACRPGGMPHRALLPLWSGPQKLALPHLGHGGGGRSAIPRGAGLAGVKRAAR
eukprot:5754464-Pyramimonas_sp.AAC.2